MGGGGWCWSADGTAIVYAAADGNLWWQPLGSGQVRRLTDHGPEHAAQAPAASPDGRWIAYVVDQAEVWTVGAAGTPPARIDDGGADFCFDPVVLPDARTVVWQAWNLPDMPWDASRMESVDVVSGERRTVRPAGQLQQPRPMPDGRIMCIRDDGGWANLWLDDRPLVEERFEHGGPTWGLGQRSYAVSPDSRRVAFTRNERGFGSLCVLDVDSGRVREVARGVHGQLSWTGDHIAAIRTGARTPTQVVVYRAGGAEVPPSAWRRRTVVVGPRDEWTTTYLVEPELVVVPIRAEDGERVDIHARLYRADPGPDGSGSKRLICWLHGGPTDQWQVTFMPRIAYWRALGWNVLVPDHRGSTGHGREYQQALRGRWGGSTSTTRSP